jgi:hypothetical protein
MCCLHEVALDAHVIGKEFNRKRIVGTDSADLCRCINDQGWLNGSDEIKCGFAIKEIDNLAANWDDLVACANVCPDDGRASKACASSNDDGHGGQSIQPYFVNSTASNSAI